MRSRLLKKLPIAGAALLATSIVAVASLAGVAAGAPAAGATATICGGTLAKPGVLSGVVRGDVKVTGVCEVNRGPATVKGNIAVTKGGALLAVYALNDKTKKGHSSLTVTGNVTAAKGSVVALGCLPSIFTCLDDPNQSSPTLQSRAFVGGSLSATNALGVLVHNASIVGNASLAGGGGGITCKPSGLFAALGSPVYSDFENDAIGGSLTISKLSSCWLGALRDWVGGNLVVTGNKMADPDANEILTNVVGGNISCTANVPAVQYGDAGGTPNVILKSASGQCSFTTLKPNPAPSGPLSHISIPSTQ